MRSLLIGLFFSLLWIRPASASEITFMEKPWEEVLAAAKTQNKLIFFDAYTSWCVPCKKMAKDVFTQDSVAAYFNQHFVNAKLDMESEEGLKFAREFHVEAYPTLFIFDASGKMLYRIVGAMKAPELMDMAYQLMEPSRSQVITALNQLNATGKVNESTQAFLAEKIRSGFVVDPLAKRYLELLPVDSLNNKQDLYIYLSCDKDYTSALSAYYIEHAADFIKQDNNGSYPLKISQLALNALNGLEGTAREKKIETLRVYLQQHIKVKKTLQKINSKVPGLNL